MTSRSTIASEQERVSLIEPVVLTDSVVFVGIRSPQDFAAVIVDQMGGVCSIPLERVSTPAYVMAFPPMFGWVRDRGKRKVIIA